jgi:A/G-specific adenine glycosylase
LFKTFQDNLLAFYQSFPIEKPWQADRDPYKIWLLEVLSQQTRMEQALPYYRRLVDRFPKIELLADASEDDLFALWKGLGYYSRARNLHNTAKYITSEREGQFPRTYADIIKLNGVGPYTASAIASFAFREDVAVLDGNVHRVLSRVFGIAKTIQRGQDKDEFQNLANKLLIKGQSDIYNQAIMNFGSTHCKPQNPNCGDCNISEICYAYQNEKVGALPPPKLRPILRDRYFHFVFVKSKDNIYLRKRMEKDIWQGLYEGVVQENKDLDVDFWQKQKLDIAGLLWSPWLKQVLSHQRIWMKIAIIESENWSSNNFQAFHTSELKNIAFPRVVSKWIEAHGFD